jgi:hypothetical protein
LKCIVENGVENFQPIFTGAGAAPCLISDVTRVSHSMIISAWAAAIGTRQRRAEVFLN